MAARPITNDDEAFLEWIKLHPQGFVLNAHSKPRKSYLKLHRSGCRTFKPPYTTTTYSKIVGDSIEELAQWARVATGSDGTFSDSDCSCLRNNQTDSAMVVRDEMGWDQEAASELEINLDLENGDQRELALLAVRLRRGQAAFREKLIAAYGSKCLFTGCEVIAVLEAAHIKPYRGTRDHAVENGLLLRADIHTLFDLNLVAINPVSLTIEVDERLRGTSYQDLKARKLQLPGGTRLSSEALQARWLEFQGRNQV